jgi:antitoxin (DNA-binding transcriptional repressor) of toxin-antitoxin stability system
MRKARNIHAGVGEAGYNVDKRNTAKAWERWSVVQITVDEMKKDPEKYLQQVEAGLVLTIVRANKPVAELHPVSLPDKQVRPFGLCAGDFVVPDNFDAPLPEDVLQAFEVR